MRVHEYFVGAALQLVSLLLPSSSLLRECMHLQSARRVPRVTCSARQGAFGPATQERLRRVGYVRVARLDLELPCHLKIRLAMQHRAVSRLVYALKNRGVDVGLQLA